MKKHSISSVVLTIIAAMFLAGAVTVYRDYRGVHFQTVLFQLGVPGNEFASGVLLRLAFHTVQHLTVIFLAAALYARVCEIRQANWRKYLPCIAAVLFLCALLCLLVSVKGIGKTICNRLSYSSVYEDYYVDPDCTSIRCPDKKRNLIVLYLESMETTYADSASGGAGDINYIPCLTQLSKDYVTFSNSTYPVGGGRSTNGADFTLGGLLASTSGITYNTSSYTGVQTDTYVNHGDVEFYNKYDAINFMPQVTALGDILYDFGYYNEFICGTTGLFAGRSSYYKSHHYDMVYDIEQFAWDDPDEKAVDITGFTAYEDDILYDAAKREIQKAAGGDKPFHIDILTIETHFPGGYICKGCLQQYDSEYGNILACADRKAASFLDWCMQQPWYQDTTIAVIGDHTFMGKNDLAEEADRKGYQRCFYNCFINSSFDKNSLHLSDRSFTTVDLFPTLLASVGIEAEGDRLGLGTNLGGSRKTLSEERGYDWLNAQLGRNSRMYKTHFNITVR